jgi:hypothetical protein
MVSRSRWLSAIFVSACVPCTLFAQTASAVIEAKGAARPANGNGLYEGLRSSLPAGDGVQVKDFTLEREGGTFHFDQGSFYFYSGVNAKITGTVFVGKGTFALSPKDASEHHSLALLAKNGVIAQDFSTLVLRFTDGTADEIRKASTGSAGKATGQAVDAASDLARGFRQKLHENYEIRLLEDVLQPSSDTSRDGFFLASFRMGGIFLGKNVLFFVDPTDTPDQVQLATWGQDSYQSWAAYKMDRMHSKAEGQGEHGGHDKFAVHVSDQKLDIVFDKSGMMKGSAVTTFVVQQDGLRVVPFDLYGTLRVTGVFSETGLPLDFVQEDKDADPQFAVILPKGARPGETIRVLTQYAGKDALKRDGDGMYYLPPSVRGSWYPAGSEVFGGFANFHMTFHLPKGLQIVATGREVSHADEPGGGTRVVWESGLPIPVGGFNLGDFKTASAKTPQGFDVSAYANVNLPDWLQPRVQHMSLGTMSTVPMLKDEVAQGDAAIQVYTNYFGKLPYDHLALTEQSDCGLGQSWPMLVYLPMCALWDSTVQQGLGLRNFDLPSYWKEVTPHEVSHQWWGHLVGFSNYRDQWMSEGFANFSVGLYLLNTRPKMDEYRDFWNEQRINLVQKNKNGLRPIDVGPLTMGYRVNNDKTGDFVAQKLIYSKGAYVLHMLEMMYWNPNSAEGPFKRSMQAFVTEYSGKAATTEDFKRSFEKTMPKWLDVKGDGKLDWFFDEYVYGTELPHYTVTSEFTTADGETTVHFKVTQSGVSKNFIMLVPLYLQMENGNTVRVANLTLHGEDVVDKTAKLGRLPSPGKKMLVNYNADVLSD